MLTYTIYQWLATAWLNAKASFLLCLPVFLLFGVGALVIRFVPGCDWAFPRVRKHARGILAGIYVCVYLFAMVCDSVKMWQVGEENHRQISGFLQSETEEIQRIEVSYGFQDGVKFRSEELTDETEKAELLKQLSALPYGGFVTKVNDKHRVNTALDCLFHYVDIYTGDGQVIRYVIAHAGHAYVSSTELLPYMLLRESEGVCGYLHQLSEQG